MFKKSEQNLRVPWRHHQVDQDTHRESPSRREKETKRTSEETETKDAPALMTDMNVHVQKAQQTPKMNPKTHRQTFKC